MSTIIPTYPVSTPSHKTTGKSDLIFYAGKEKTENRPQKRKVNNKSDTPKLCLDLSHHPICIHKPPHPLFDPLLLFFQGLLHQPPDLRNPALALSRGCLCPSFAAIKVVFRDVWVALNGALVHLELGVTPGDAVEAAVNLGVHAGDDIEPVGFLGFEFGGVKA